MFVAFWGIVALLGILLTKNARYALRQYAADRNRLVLTLYFVFLVALGWTVLHMTSRMFSLVQTVQEENLELNR